MSNAKAKILIVEDEAFVAMDIADALEDHGFELAGIAMNVKQALDLIDECRPSAAVLDVNLGKEFVWPVARQLKQLQVPIIFSTADLAHGELHDEFVSEPKIEKPLIVDRLIGEIASLAWPSTLSLQAQA